MYSIYVYVHIHTHTYISKYISTYNGITTTVQYSTVGQYFVYVCG